MRAWRAGDSACAGQPAGGASAATSGVNPVGTIHAEWCMQENVQEKAPLIKGAVF